MAWIPGDVLVPDPKHAIGSDLPAFDLLLAVPAVQYAGRPEPMRDVGVGPNAMVGSEPPIGLVRRDVSTSGVARSVRGAPVNEPAWEIEPVLQMRPLPLRPSPEPGILAGGKHARCRVESSRPIGTPPKRILITGMSGTGKSTLIAALAGLGYRAVDVDDEGWSRVADDGGWIWREELVERCLDEHESGTLFLSGCAESQVRFYPRFDHIVLLSAPAPVLEERLRTRTNNPYGKRPGELAEVLEYRETVEPLLRRAANHEIDTTASPEVVLDTVLRLVGEPGLGDREGEG